ncbi:MAG TPA: gamma-glutamyl-gamma-aminobutyrate hydrolase family protein [Polyangiaceae bacterium]|nr:gamma-glutamyl-gamma-aminobutyrate hydrolase family protein [Polyangiaceae bacterium]
MSERAPTTIVVQHAPAEGPGRLGRALEAAGVALRVVRADLGEPVPASLEGASSLVVLGGAMGASDTHRYPHLRAELALLEHALARSAPVLGICLGSQLLATALGARVYPSGRPEIGWGEVWLGDEAAADPLFAGVPRRFGALHWHNDVFELPRGARGLASSALTAHQAFGLGGHAYGLLFHLEPDAAQVKAMADESADELRAAGVDPTGLARDAERGAAGADRVARALFGAFAELARAAAR